MNSREEKRRLRKLEAEMRWQAVYEAAEYYLELQKEQDARNEKAGQAYADIESEKPPTEWVRAWALRPLVSVGQRPATTESARAPTLPPRAGLWMLAVVVPRETLDAVEGDLAEDFARYAEERGRAFAVFWYWRQIAVSALPFLWRTIEGVARLAEVWKKISGG